MESSARAFRHKLEPFEDERIVGPWRTAGHVDLVSERRYLASWAAADAGPRIDAAVFAFRCDAASAIAPDTCPPALEITTDDGRVEVLSAYAQPIESGPYTDASIEAAMRALLDTLAALEAHAFYASHLAPEFLCTDERGGLVIVPAAYAFPPDALDASAAPGAAPPLPGAHVRAIGALSERLAPHASAKLAGRLGVLSRAAASGGVDSAASMALLFDGVEVAPAGAAPETSFDPAEVVRAIEGAQLVEVAGPARSGRTTVLEQIADVLRRRGVPVHWIDEWDSAAAVRRKGSGKDGARSAVWIVDDADDRPLLHALLLDYVSGLEGRPGSGLIVGTDGGNTDSFASRLRARSAHGVHTIRLSPGGDALDGRLALLDPLEAEARQVLELAAVAGISLPVDIVLSVFPGADRQVHRQIFALAGKGLLRVESRRLPSASVSLILRVPSASLRRAIYEQIPESRRCNLHRTVARIASERGTFPPMFEFEHLVRGDERDRAAASAAAFFKGSSRIQRAPFIEAILRDIVEDGLDDALAYGDRMALLVRLGEDLLGRGRQREAETILTRAKSIRASGDDIRANAPLASEAMRLLADAWAGRGQLREALALLNDTREDIAPYLSLADQARLINDIGWLQYRLGDYSSGVDSCKFSITSLNPNEHPLVVAQALNLMGVIAFNTSRYDEAISYYEQSAFLREREVDLNALAGSYNNLALAYQSKGEYDKALAYLDKSIGIKSRQNNEAGIAGGYLNLAVLHLEVHNFDEAERRCRESLRISSRLELAQMIAENLNTLGDIVFARGLLDDAEDYYRRSLEHARRLSTVSEEMGAHKRLAKLYIRKGRHEDARKAVDEATRLARKVGSKYEQAQTEEISGDLLAATGNRAESIDHFDKATTLYATLSKQRQAAACLAKAGLAHARGGNPLDGKRYLDRAQDLIKSQIGHEIPEEMVTLQQTLREHPLPSGVTGTASQKLLYAFYELSSLSDYADDRGAFFRRVVAVFRDLVGATTCVLAIRTEDGRFIRVDVTGEEEPVVDPTSQAVFARSLQLGTVLHCASPEIKDILASAPAPPDPDTRLVVVPMKSMGEDLGCVVLTVPPTAVPESKEDLDFISCIGRHVAGDLRLSLHLDERSQKEATLVRGIDGIGAQIVDKHRFQSMIGRDESMQKVFRIVEKIKDMDTGILINGESGTGKTELARTIHNNSPRRRHVFQSIHCAEIPTSLLESELFGHERGAFTGAVQRKLGRCEVADGGTVFLDDVNAMPSEIQSSLLHYLETKSFTRVGGTQKISTDVRIIAASNEDLETLVKQGRFREDLFYRLKVIQIELPPLRDRREDLILIAQAFLKKRCQAQGKPLKRLSTETIKLFQKYRWPGNVRELQNVLEQIVLLCDDDLVEPSSLPEDFLRRAAGGGKSQWQSLEQLARQMVESGGYSPANPLMPQVEALLASKMAEYADNKVKAASLLGITKPTLYTRLRGYDRLK